MRDDQLLQQSGTRPLAPTTVRRRPRRTGFTLVEMLGIITLASVVITITAAFLVALFRGDSAGRMAMVRQHVVARLAEQFRADAHAAAAFSLLEEPQAAENHPPAYRWQFTLPGHCTVEYCQQHDSVLRVERCEQGIERQESYRLGPELVASAAEQPIEPAEHAAATLVVLKIDRRDGTSQAAMPSLRIEALLGKDLQLTALPAQQPNSQ